MNLAEPHIPTQFDSSAPLESGVIVPFPDQPQVNRNGKPQDIDHIASVYERDLAALDDSALRMLVKHAAAKILDDPRTLKVLESTWPVVYKVLLAWSNVMIAYAHRKKDTT